MISLTYVFGIGRSTGGVKKGREMDVLTGRVGRRSETFHIPAPSDIRTAMSFQADYVAVSFPKNATDMEMARQLCNVAGADWRHKPGYLHYDTPYLLICDNLLDFSHLSFVHESSLGGSTRIAEGFGGLFRRVQGLFARFDWVFYLPPRGAFDQVIDDYDIRLGKDGTVVTIADTTIVLSGVFDLTSADIIFLTDADWPWF